jgi:hypothetical protein
MDGTAKVATNYKHKKETGDVLESHSRISKAAAQTETTYCLQRDPQRNSSAP